MTDVYTYDAHYEPLSEVMVKVVSAHRHGVGEWRMHPVQMMMVVGIAVFDPPVYHTGDAAELNMAGRYMPHTLCDRKIIEDIAMPPDEIHYELDGDVVGIITRLQKPEGM